MSVSGFSFKAGMLPYLAMRTLRPAELSEAPSASVSPSDEARTSRPPLSAPLKNAPLRPAVASLTHSSAQDATQFAQQAALDANFAASTTAAQASALRAKAAPKPKPSQVSKPESKPIPKPLQEPKPSQDSKSTHDPKRLQDAKGSDAKCFQDANALPEPTSLIQSEPTSDAEVASKSDPEPDAEPAPDAEDSAAWQQPPPTPSWQAKLYASNADPWKSGGLSGANDTLKVDG